MAQRLKRLPAMRETWVRSLGWEDPLEKEMAPHSSILAWKIPRMEEPVGYSPRGRKESDTTERLHFRFHFRASEVALVVKNPPTNAGDARDIGSIPGLGRTPGVGNGNTLQYSCLENSIGRGAWQATDHRAAKSRIQLST